MATILDGKRTAELWRQELKQRVDRLQAEHGMKPGLAVVRVGEDPASIVYVRNKARAAAEAGIHSVVVELPAAAGPAALFEAIDRQARDPLIHGLLVQLPLPRGYDPEAVQERVPPEKDVDGLHPLNQGLLALGRPRFIPATPLGIVELLRRYAIPIAGAQVLVLGRSAIVGRPLATLLSNRGPFGDATVTVAHSRSKDLPALGRAADILVAAIGRPEFVGADLVRPGATVIDVGINRISDPAAKSGGRLVGDVDFAAVAPIAGAITPVPGGVGPMTIAGLVHNTLTAAEQAAAAVRSGTAGSAGMILRAPELGPGGRPFTVSEILKRLRRAVETSLPRAVAITGEVVDLTSPNSGHLYFCLRDPGGVLRCVMFRAQSQLLRFPLRNGMQVEAQGIMTVYAPSGQIQLQVDVLAPAGRGALLAALEALKTRLAAEGLFAPERKRSLPSWPRAVGIVTSPSGAALHDLVRVIRARAPWVRILFSPARVQGDGAAADLARALQRLNRHGQAEVIIVGRGGGALEDLWAFNAEVVVRAVAGSRIPVVSAVGHETDITLSDLAADHRAATPSHAAEQVVPDGAATRAQVEAIARRLGVGLARQGRARAERFADLPARLPRALRAREQRAQVELEQRAARLARAATRITPVRVAQLVGLEGRLIALGPGEVLRRGYALVRGAGGQVISHAAGLHAADRLRLDFQDGQVTAAVESVALGSGLVAKDPRQP